MKRSKVHYHEDQMGLLVECYHKCRSGIPGFVIGTLVAFPIEHYLYEKVWPFTLITKWLGL